MTNLHFVEHAVKQDFLALEIILGVNVDQIVITGERPRFDILRQEIPTFLPRPSFCSCPGKCYLIKKGGADIMIKFGFFTSFSGRHYTH